MTQPEQRRSERLLLTVPIRVMGFETASGDFSEDTHTTVVNRTGARIALKHRLAVEDSLRIINLENYNEADFRVVGPTAWSGEEINEWGVECIELERNIWGIDFPPPLAGESGALVECRACHRQAFSALTPMELEVLNATGVLQRACDQCGKPTSWTYADVTRHPREFPPTQTATAPPRAAKADKQAEKRRAKRLGMKLQILVRGPRGQQEITKTENVSKGGLAVSLSMDLALGDIVKIVCPYAPGGQNIEERTEVRRRATFSYGGRRLYGLRHLR